jgi:hypothetical protein
VVDESASDGLVPEILVPENLDTKTFDAVLNRATSDLPDGTKAQVVRALGRLRPSAESRAQDDAQKVVWASWEKKAASQESHDKALIARLESIACVADGAPFVARGLLLTGRFDKLYENNQANEQEKRRIVERLKTASAGGNPTCLGAQGLLDEDFKVAP